MTILNCDTKGCGFSEEINFKDVPKFFNKPCKNCGNKTLVSKKDMSIWAIISCLIRLGLAKEGGLSNEKGIEIHINTAEL